MVPPWRTTSTSEAIKLRAPPEEGNEVLLVGPTGLLYLAFLGAGTIVNGTSTLSSAKVE